MRSVLATRLLQAYLCYKQLSGAQLDEAETALRDSIASRINEENAVQDLACLGPLDCRIGDIFGPDDFSFFKATFKFVDLELLKDHSFDDLAVVMGLLFNPQFLKQKQIGSFLQSIHTDKKLDLVMLSELGNYVPNYLLMNQLFLENAAAFQAKRLSPHDVTQLQRLFAINKSNVTRRAPNPEALERQGQGEPAVLRGAGEPQLVGPAFRRQEMYTNQGLSARKRSTPDAARQRASAWARTTRNSPPSTPTPSTPAMKQAVSCCSRSPTSQSLPSNSTN